MLTKMQVKEEIRKVREEHAEGEANIRLTKALNDLERNLRL